MLQGAKVTLIVTGSIAAYKSAEIVRELLQRGAKVSVVMTEAATKFITPLTLEALSGKEVLVDMFGDRPEVSMSHITLADEADVVLVAPASADIIARARQGLSGDLATAILLVTRAPVVMAPAMNVNMWENELTRKNVAALREHGFHFAGPADGELACGWVGSGRLAEVSDIIHTVQAALTPKDLLGSRVIVTAGPTQEDIDPVRYISNRSTGKMGYAIARAASRRGAHVSLITGPTNLTVPAGIDVHPVGSALEMKDRLFELVGNVPQHNRPKSTDFVFMVAAVTDFRPAAPSLSKMKPDKKKAFGLECSPNPDILAELGARREEIETANSLDLKLIGFTAETGEVEDLLNTARQKLTNKKLDLIVANLAEDSFGKDTNRVWLVDKFGRQEAVTLMDKESVAEKVITAAIRV